MKLGSTSTRGRYWRTLGPFPKISYFRLAFFDASQQAIEIGTKNLPAEHAMCVRSGLRRSGMLGRVIRLRTLSDLNSRNILFNR